MTTEDVHVVTPAEEVAGIQANLDNARKLLSEATAAFTAMLSDAGKGKTIDEQLAISQAVKDSQAKVETLEKSLKAATSRARVASLEVPAKSLRDALHKALTTVSTKTLLDADTTGIRFIANVKVNKDGTSAWEVSSSFMGANAPVAPKSGVGATGGAKGQNRYVADGKQYATREYIEAFAADAIAAGKVNWTGDPTDSVGLSHRADVLAEKLGHDKIKVAPSA